MWRGMKGCTKSITRGKLRACPVLYVGSKCTRFNAHTLVAKHFLEGVPENMDEVNHKDGDRTNNHVDNLEWSNRKHNSLHSTRVLCKNRGQDNKQSKLTKEQVLEIKGALLRGCSQANIALVFNVTNHCIYRIAHGYNWAWLTGFGKEGTIVCQSV